MLKHIIICRILQPVTLRQRESTNLYTCESICAVTHTRPMWYAHPTVTGYCYERLQLRSYYGNFV